MFRIAKENADFHFNMKAEINWTISTNSPYYIKWLKEIKNNQNVKQKLQKASKKCKKERRAENLNQMAIEKSIF